jgi:hypothetical protein
MDSLGEGLVRLDAARRRQGLESMPRGLPEAEVQQLLEGAGVATNDHLVTWYAHYGPGRLLPGAFVAELRNVVDMYLDVCAVAQDWRDDSDAYSQAVDWFPIASDFWRTVIWARESTSAPAVAAQNELAQLEPALGAEKVTLPELVDAWTVRLDMGYYTPRQPGGTPWFRDALTDEVRRKSGM